MAAEPLKGTIRIEWESVERLPDGTEEFTYAVRGEPPLADERLSALLAEIAQRL